MAAAEGGYDYNFVTLPDEDLKCVICLEVCRDPLQHEACGKLFCQECIERFGKDKPCPHCQVEHAQFYVDHRSRRVIQDLAVRCHNVDRSCEWQGTVNTVNTHLASCQFASIHCPQDCGEEILRKDSVEHMNTACLHRMYICLSCGVEDTYVEITGIHDFVCEKKIVYCSNTKCQQTMERCQVEEHVKSVCDYTLISCKYESFGCGVKMERRHMTAHEEDNILHLHVAMATTSQLQQKVSKLESSLQEAIENISMLMQKVDEQQQQATVGALKQVDLECTIKPIKSSISSLEKQQIALWSSTRDLVEDSIRPVKSSITLLENKVNVFNSRVLSEFTVNHYSEKKLTDKTFTCQPFYTNGRCYNLAIEIKTNGIRDSYGIDVSAFVLVKPGKNDATLPWPFVGKVTIILLNQLDDKNHHAMTVPIEAADNVLVGDFWGYDRFISQSELNSAQNNTCYLLNDQLRFRICYW